MELRLRFDPHLDEKILARIERKANGGSKNKALLFLVRYWFELETVPNVGNMLPGNGHISGNLEGCDNNELTNALAEIDDIFS
jgi:hypothetical protein